MASPEPDWRVKSRPCPFYQQGRCLFADSCNFIHSVSIRASAGPVSSPQRPMEHPTPSTPVKSLVVTVDSPRSVRSPPRSPRLNGLLLALRDIIGEDPDDEFEAGEQSTTYIDTEDWSPGLPTLVNESGSGSFPFNAEDDTDEDSSTQPDDHLPPLPFSPASNRSSLDRSGSAAAAKHDIPPDDDDSSRIAPSPQPDENDNHPSICTIQSSPDTEPPPTPSSPISAHNNDLLSPVDLSHLHLAAFTQIDHGFHAISDDPEAADAWKTPTPLLRSPPRSPGHNSTFELLTFPFGSPSARVLSPRIGAFIPRSPASASPFQEHAQPPEFDLDSPDNYRLPEAVAETQDAHTARLSEQAFSFTPRVGAGSPVDEQEADFGLEEEEDLEHEDSLGSTANWDSEAGPTAVFVGTEESVQEEVNQTINHLSGTPTHFLTSGDVDFVDAETMANSSAIEETPLVVESSEDEESQQEAADTEEDEEDSTAHLAYLSSPTAVLNEGDTLNSLYDIYSFIEKEERQQLSTPAHISVVIPQRAIEKKVSSSSSTPSSALRDRVFTPPPHGRGRSGTVTADSPTSLDSPATSPDSMPRGRVSPFSARSSPGVHSQEVEVSKKVPFGFRHSFALGRAKNSSLISNRMSKPIPPPLLDTAHMTDENEEPASSLSPTSPHGTGSRLKPLRLSAMLDGSFSIPPLPTPRTSTSSTYGQQSGNVNRISISSTSVSSTNSLSHNPLLSSPRSSLIPAHIRNTLLSSQARSPSPLSSEFGPNALSTFDEPQSAPVAHSQAWRSAPGHSHRPSLLTNLDRPSSRFSEPALAEFEEDDPTESYLHYERDPYDETICRPVQAVPHTAPVTRAASAMRQSTYAIATPRPTLMFAIASDDVEQVRQVLESGEAGPNDTVGPQSALEFALTNNQLAHKMEIVKTLLAFGADPSALKTHSDQQHSGQRESRVLDSEDKQPVKSLIDEMDPAIRYYMERADSPHTRRTSALIHRSFFRPLTRVRYELIGQDRALEQLFRVLSMHSRVISATPIVVLLCGPSGHGKSLLARKFGSLLDVPTHTVNMTTLKSTHDLWQSYSMSPYEAPSTCSLAEFLINNEGKRCVVVLDEIEKTEDEKVLWSLLMPWEFGRCLSETNSRHIDVRNVIWLGTSNIGHNLVFEHRDARERPDELMSREEYVELMGLLRPRVSERLGASVLSRVTTVLPFVPFTHDEMEAICSEALHNLGGDVVWTLSPAVVKTVVDMALASYSPPEGARSLYRAISNQLVDII